MKLPETMEEFIAGEVEHIRKNMEVRERLADIDGRIQDLKEERDEIEKGLSLYRFRMSDGFASLHNEIEKRLDGVNEI